MWSLVSGPSPSAALGTLLQAASSASLRLPPNSLHAGAIYVFQVHLQVGDDATKTSAATVEVVVRRRPVLAQIAQGNTVYRSTKASFSLDASPSRDMDKLAKDPQALIFTWSCTFFDGFLTSSCTDAVGDPLILAASPNITLGAGELAPTDGAPYTFSVEVQDSQLQKPANAASIFVYVSQIPVLEVMITLQSFDTAFRGSQLLVNADHDLVLFATCHGAPNNRPAPAIMWDISPAPQASLTELSVSSSYLVIKGDSGALRPGTDYTFTASCSTWFMQGTQASNISGRARLSLSINDSPTGGGCSACLKGTAPGTCVTTGEKIFDAFRMACSRWADQDSPLMFRFGFSTTGQKNDATWGAYGSTQHKDLVFPAGNISIFAEVQVCGRETASIMMP